MALLVPTTPPDKTNGVALKMTTSTLICPKTPAKDEQNNILSNSVSQEEDSILKAYTDMKEAILWWEGEDKHSIEDTHLEDVMKKECPSNETAQLTDPHRSICSSRDFSGD